MIDYCSSRRELTPPPPPAPEPPLSVSQLVRQREGFQSLSSEAAAAGATAFPALYDINWVC